VEQVSYQERKNQWDVQCHSHSIPTLAKGQSQNLFHSSKSYVNDPYKENKEVLNKFKKIF
jgi:hypothetical protein